MTEREQMSAELSEEQKKAVFLELVEAQDSGVPVPQSRKQIAEKFSVSEDDVKVIEKAGIAEGWPPL